MLFDLKQIVDGGETNYISATLALYLDIFNVFQSLLALLGIIGGETRADPALSTNETGPAGPFFMEHAGRRSRAPQLAA